MCTSGWLTSIRGRLSQFVLGRDSVYVRSELGLEQAMRMEHMRMPKPTKVLRESEMRHKCSKAIALFTLTISIHTYFWGFLASLLASSARRWIVLRAALTEDSFFLSKSDDHKVALHQIPLHEVVGISSGSDSQTVIQPVTKYC